MGQLASFLSSCRGGSCRLDSAKIPSTTVLEQRSEYHEADLALIRYLGLIYLKPAFPK